MRWWLLALVVGLLGLGVAAAGLGWFRPRRAGPDPRPVPAGDREVAWLHNPTSFESWENFVWGIKRAEMAADGPAGLEVDDSKAFPERTTDVPEVVVRRKGFAGSLRVRWYKYTDEATQQAWVYALAARDPAPLAVIGGWSSDRARELADAMRGAKWPGAKPLLFLTQATADVVSPEDDAQPSGPGPGLISVYEQSFRFCFTNRQMAEAVTAFVLSEPSLRPGPVAPPGLHAAPTMAAGPWAGLTALATGHLADPAPVQAFALRWEDDPYSVDLSDKFCVELKRQATRPRVGSIALLRVPFSTGRLNRPNPREAGQAEHILANLPPPGTRSVLVIPTVSAPARRTMRALVQGDPSVGHRLVAVTGDGLSVNTLFRDREFAWPVRSLPVPFVLFTHADPFGWDTPGAGPAPPPGYELSAPRPGEARTTTEDIRLFTRVAGIVAAGFFPDGRSEIAGSPDEVAARLRSLEPPFFDAAGNRRSDTGEHVVVLRPAFPGDVPGRPRIEATLEVYTRLAGQSHWSRVHALPLGRPHGSQAP